MLFLFAVPFNLFAQEYDHWEVGTDLLWMINKNQSYPSFFIKKLSLKKKKREIAGYQLRGYRFRLGFNYDSPNQSNPTNATSNYNSVSAQTLVRAGYEWHKSISTFDIFYGWDGYFEYGFNSIDQQYATGGTSYNATRKTTDIKAGISPIAGLKYKFSPSVYASMESDVQILFHRSKSSNTQTLPYLAYYDLPSGNGVLITAHPIYVINLVFVFR